MFAMLFYVGKCYCSDVGNINFSWDRFNFKFKE